LQSEKTRSKFLTDIMAKEEAIEPRESVKDFRAAIPTPMLDVVFKSGAIVSFSYAYLTRIDFDPSGKLEMYFGDDVLVVEGRNLRDMRQKVRLHKADEIHEGNEAEGALKPESSAHVDSIQIVSEKEAKREVERDSGAKHKGIER
jgi:hypothetical protein